MLLVDDHAVLRAGFRAILEAQDDITVVGEAATGAEAVAAASALRPDVICMDVQMPDMDGIAATRLIVADPDVPSSVVIVTTFDRDDYLFAALDAGASGFLLKNAGPEELVSAVRVVAGGDALLAPEVTRRVIERYAAPGAGPARPRPRPQPRGAALRAALVLAESADRPRGGGAAADDAGPQQRRDRRSGSTSARPRSRPTSPRCCRSSAPATACRPSSSPTAPACLSPAPTGPRAGPKEPPRDPALPGGGAASGTRSSLAWERHRPQEDAAPCWNFAASPRPTATGACSTTSPSTSPPGPAHRLRRRQRRRQDDHHAHRARRARQGRRRGAARRRAADHRRPPPLRLHARGAGALPADEGASSTSSTSPGCTASSGRMPRRGPPRCSRSSGSASG